MTTNRKPFMPLDVDDQKLERLAAQKGVGRLEPLEVQTAGGEGANAYAIVAGAPADGALTATKLKTVNLELPDYVWTELKIRAAHQQTSLKHVIMKALRKDNITIKEADMIEDGRRLRGSKAAVPA